MRETVGIPAGILVYSISIVILLIAVQILVDEPRQWSWQITAAVAVISFKITCAAVQNFSNNDGVKIVGIMIAIFWLASLGADMFGGLEALLEFLDNGQRTIGLENLKELTEAVWNKKICAGTSLILALWTLTK